MAAGSCGRPPNARERARRDAADEALPEPRTVASRSDPHRDSRPVLSPSLSFGTPTLSSIDSSRFVIGVWSGYFRCRPPLMPAGAAADHEIRQREMIVRVAVAHVAAVEDQRVIEQRAVAVLDRVELARGNRRTAPMWYVWILTSFSIFSGAVLVVRRRRDALRARRPADRSGCLPRAPP